MSTAPTPPKRDLTLAEVARRLEWKGVCAVGTGFMSALGLILGVTIWILQNTCETKLATAETKLERRQQDVDELRGKLGSAVAEKDAGLARLKEQNRVNAVKNQFLSLCMTYYSAAERHNISLKRVFDVCTDVRSRVASRISRRAAMRPRRKGRGSAF